MAEGDEASELILSKDASEAQGAVESSLVDYLSKCDRIDRHNCWIFRKKKRNPTNLGHWLHFSSIFIYKKEEK